MKKKILALLLAGVMVLSTGCSANISVDPDTGVVYVDGIPANELLKDLSSEDSDEETDEADADADTKDEDTKDDGDEPGDGVEELKGGLKIKYPEAFINAKGIIYNNSFEIDDGTGVYVTNFSYAGATEEWVNEHIYIDDPDPKDREKYSKERADFTYILSINNNRGLDELGEIVKEAGDDFDAKDYTEIAKAEDCTFYRYTKADKIGAENLEDEFKKEFDTLYDMIDDVLKDAEYFSPVEPYADIVGKKIEFTTTDIDGNPITSDEIFSKNEVTMINVWATWCYWCIDELPELNEINDRLAKKNCAIVGIVGDGTDEDTIEEAKELLKENGDEYLNILPWEDALTDDFPMSEGWPTSFFVDKEGRIASKPVTGANVKKYERVVDEILAGKEPESGTEDGEQAQVIKNDVKQYRIYVSDMEGNLIEGAMVQLCDDSTCRVEKTDKSGLAVFKVDQNEYTVHLLKQPKGYKKDNQEYKLPDEYSDLHIILEKE